MNLVKDINGETSIDVIYSEISSYLNIIEGWLYKITPYNYAFKTYT
jgi:hypothetical protein